MSTQAGDHQPGVKQREERSVDIDDALTTRLEDQHIDVNQAHTQLAVTTEHAIPATHCSDEQETEVMQLQQQITDLKNELTKQRHDYEDRIRLLEKALEESKSRDAYKATENYYLEKELDDTKDGIKQHLQECETEISQLNAALTNANAALLKQREDYEAKLKHLEKELKGFEMQGEAQMLNERADHST